MCSYCNVVNRLCYWGPRPQAKWKRPSLIIISLIAVLGIPTLIWTVPLGPSSTGLLGTAILFLIITFLWLVGILGVLIGWHGCDACVARLMGEA